MKRILLIAAMACCHCLALTANVEKVVILGSGPAGLTAAIFAGQSNLYPLIVDGEEAGGQPVNIHRIENYPGFPEGIDGKELTERFRQQAEIFGAHFHPSHVVSLDLTNRPFHIILADGQELFAESLVVATGTIPKPLGLAAEEALKDKGVSTNATRDAPRFKSKEVVVVGGGDVAMESALVLAEHASKVTVIYSKDQFYASSYLQERVFANRKIATRFNTEVVEILDLSQKRVTGVVVKDVKTKKQSSLACEGIFIANGRIPNTKLFSGKLEMTDAGYIVTHPDTTKTSVAGVFAAGDIMQNAYRKVVTSTASGAMSAIDATLFLKDQK